MEANEKVTIPQDTISSETLSMILSRIQELELHQALLQNQVAQQAGQITQQAEQINQQAEQINQQAEQIARQANQIHALQKRNLILQSKVDGQENGFYLFSLLPAEIRGMIWVEALLSGRVVELDCKEYGYYRILTKVVEHYPTLHQYRNSHPGYQHHIVGFPSIFDRSLKIDILLATCQDSREYTLKTLKGFERSFDFNQVRGNFDAECKTMFFKFPRLLKEGDVPIPHADLKKGQGIRLRPEKDIVYLRDLKSEKLGIFWDLIVNTIWNRVQFKSIRTFAVDLSLFNLFWSNIAINRTDFLLEGVRELILVDVTGSRTLSLSRNIGYTYTGPAVNYTTVDGIITAVNGKLDAFSRAFHIQVPRASYMTLEEFDALR